MDGQGYIRPQNLQGYQNESFADDSFDIFASVPNNDVSWDLNSMNNEPIAQSTAPHPNWQQSAASTPGLDTYGRSFSKGPSDIQAATTYGYGDPHQYLHSPYDPSLVPSTSVGDNSNYVGHSTFGHQAMQHGTIAPQALQHEQPQFSQTLGNIDSQGYSRNRTTAATGFANSLPPVPTADQASLCAAVPQGVISGLFSNIDFEKLVSATNTRRVNAFVNVGQQEFEYPINKAIVPNPARRRSRNELRQLARNDPKLLAKFGKKHHKKTHGSASAVKAQPLLTKSWQPTPGIKYEGDASSSDESSSEDSDDYSDDELAEPSPLPARRPDTPLEAVKYDSIKSTWRSKRFEVDSTEIRNGLKDFWEVVRTIRDRWKTDTAAVTQAEEKKQYGEVPLLKSRVKDQRNMLETALTTAIEYGHKSILELFGENASFLYLLYQFLLDRFKEEDFDGRLTRAILEILANCTTLTEENLEKTRLGKVYPRFAKKGSMETKALVKRIDASVADHKKKRNDSTGQGAPKTEAKTNDPKAPKSPPMHRSTPEPVAGVKRAAPSGVVSGQPQKRVASTASGAAGAGPGSPASTTSSTANKTILPVKRSITSTATSNKPLATNITATTARPKPIGAKPAGGSLAASAGVKKAVPAKPVSSSVVANAIKSIEKKAATPAGSSAPTKPAFSFAETMANLTKPKEREATPKEEDKRPPETVEQKAKRLRKEQRRKLRVTFRPDNQLVEVRIFHHDAEEEVGHDASMIRDVSDVGGEGRMFKQHKDMAEVEDDEEPGEEDLREYHALSLIDFSNVDADERRRNYAPFGGGEAQPESLEKGIREQYEANTLMAYDSPPCPREPVDPYNGEPVATRSFGDPDPQSIVATRAARFTTQPSAALQQSSASTGPDISAILALIKPQQPTAAAPQAGTGGQVSNPIPDLLGLLANMPQASAQPQQNPTTPNIANILANLQSQGAGNSTASAIQQQHAHQQPQMAGMVPPPNLAAIFGQLNQAPNGPQMGNAGAFPFQMPALDMNNFAQSQQQNESYDNEERRRWRDNGEEDAGSQGRKWAAKKGGVKGKHYTLPCKYWKLGKCQKGDNCTYLHE
ncbi:hypothetical protein AAFC00_000965 [Neodothiora populina]|uniref:C3H1-type domain-containing protein n=1 Tax=Neodothiora populina TaxID=2781224 RepID=A0ABR3PMD1_9PEZI